MSIKIKSKNKNQTNYDETREHIAKKIGWNQENRKQIKSIPQIKRMEHTYKTHMNSGMNRVITVLLVLLIVLNYHQTYQNKNHLLFENQKILLKDYLHIRQYGYVPSHTECKNIKVSKCIIDYFDFI